MKKITSFRFFQIVLMSFLILFSFSCEKDDEDKKGTIGDENFYSQLGYALVKCYTDIYNQNLAGHLVGAQNITANGPMGGTVIITGVTGYSTGNDITTTDLVFTMTSIQYTNSSSGYLTDITLNGATTYTGSFSDDYTSVNHQSENMHINGSVTYGDIVRAIDRTGEVSINRSSTTAVNIFGNTVNW
jgi:hypothetical protein